MHVHVQGRCLGETTWISPGEEFGMHRPGQCGNLFKAHANSLAEKAPDDDIVPEMMPDGSVERGPRLMPPLLRPCCGSRGRRHKKKCRGGTEARPSAPALVGYLSDHRSDCCKGLVVPEGPDYRCLECHERCQPVKIEALVEDR